MRVLPSYCVQFHTLAFAFCIKSRSFPLQTKSNAISVTGPQRHRDVRHLESRLTDGGEVVNLTRRLRFVLGAESTPGP
jgi:hypothetical protein